MRIKINTRLVILAFSVSACAPSHHTIEPYRSDSQSAMQLERSAGQTCQQSVSIPLPVKTFVTDGCSMWPDGTWAECCVNHDIPYWCGGSSQQRRDADRTLKMCVSNRHSNWMGALMYWGVRVGGHPWIPFHWRWGFGRAYPAGYTN